MRKQSFVLLALLLLVLNLAISQERANPGFVGESENIRKVVRHRERQQSFYEANASGFLIDSSAAKISQSQWYLSRTEVLPIPSLGIAVVDRSDGVYVSHVIPPPEGRDPLFEVGDKIVRIDEQEIETAASLDIHFYDVGVGFGSVKLYGMAIEVLREGKSLTVKYTKPPGETMPGEGAEPWHQKIMLEHPAFGGRLADLIQQKLLAGTEGVRMEDEAVRPYDILEVDADNDGELEYVVAGGTTTFFGIGTCFVLDFQEGEARIYDLVDGADGFIDLRFADFDRDGKNEIMSNWRAGSGAYLNSYIFQWDGNGYVDLFPDGRDVYQGNFEILDANLDGKDDIVVWRGILGDDECNQCPHYYDVITYIKTEGRFQFYDYSQTEFKQPPQDIVGRNTGVTGLPFDLGHNLIPAESYRLLLVRYENIADEDLDELYIKIARQCFALMSDKVYSRALEYGKLLLEISGRFSNDTLRLGRQAFAYASLGNTQLYLMNPGEGEIAFNKSNQIYSALGNQEAVEENYSNMAVLFYNTDLQKSMQYGLLAADKARELNDHSGLALILGNLGLTFFQLGDLAEGIRFIEESLYCQNVLLDSTWLDEKTIPPLAELLNENLMSNPDGTLFFNLSRLAVGYRALQDFKRSNDLLFQARLLAELSLARDYYANVESLLGQNAYLQRRHPEAVQHLRKALLMTTQDNLEAQGGVFYLYLGDTYQALGDYDTGRNCYENVLKIVGDKRDFSTKWKAHWGLGQIERRLGRVKEAFHHYDQAIESLTAASSTISVQEIQIAFFDDSLKTRLYEETISLLYDLGLQPEAYFYVERARAQAFRNLLGTKSNAGFRDDEHFVMRERGLLTKIADLESKLRSTQVYGGAVRKRAVEWNEELSATAEEYRSLMLRTKIENPDLVSVAKIEAVTVDQMQKLLDDKTLIVEYFLAGDTCYVAAISNRDFDLSRYRIERAIVEQQITYLYDIINTAPGKQQVASIDQPLMKLYDLLVRPAERLLRDNRQIDHLLIVPHDVMHYLPFHLLHDGQAYLISRYAISYAPSATVLALKLRENRQQNAAPNLLLVGRTDTGLKFVANEMEDISSLFHRRREILADTNATESHLKSISREYDFIHFATHGIFNPAQPMLSYLDLVADEQDDGRLTAYDIMPMNLERCSMVTLSACQSNQSLRTRGDDLVGLTRSFMFAGAETVVASLWNVDDESTALLMSRFYQNLQSLSKARALQRAMNELRDTPRYAHPYYWGAFELQGDWR